MLFNLSSNNLSLLLEEMSPLTIEDRDSNETVCGIAIIAINNNDDTNLYLAAPLLAISATIAPP